MLSRYFSLLRISLWKRIALVTIVDMRLFQGRNNMRNRRIIASFLLCVLAAAPLQGEVLPDRWEKVEQLQPGTSIIIRLKTGDRLEGAFKSVSPEAVAFTEGSAQDRMIPKSAVQKIETSAKVPDRLRNGILIGLLAGVASGLVAMVAYANAVTNGPVYWDEDGPAYLLGTALVGGGIGAATGAVVDASIKRHEVLFQAR